MAKHRNCLGLIFIIIAIVIIILLWNYNGDNKEDFRNSDIEEYEDNIDDLEEYSGSFTNYYRKYPPHDKHVMWDGFGTGPGLVDSTRFYSSY